MMKLLGSGAFDRAALVGEQVVERALADDAPDRGFGQRAERGVGIDCAKGEAAERFGFGVDPILGTPVNSTSWPSPVRTGASSSQRATASTS